MPNVNKFNTSVEEEERRSEELEGENKKGKGNGEIGENRENRENREKREGNQNNINHHRSKVSSALEKDSVLEKVEKINNEIEKVINKVKADRRESILREADRISGEVFKFMENRRGEGEQERGLNGGELNREKQRGGEEVS